LMSDSDREGGAFTASLGCLVEPTLAALAAQLDAITDLTPAERRVFSEGAATALYETVHRKVARVLLLELHAARVTGKLTAATSQQRWEEFLALSATVDFWDSLAEHYPALSPRLRRVIDNRCTAALTVARRFAADRGALGALPGADVGEVTQVRFSAGDSHRGGQTVTVLRGTDGQVVYKPRSVAVDAALGDFLRWILPDEPAATRIRVPAVLVRDGYGWAEYIPHRYCANSIELEAFHRALGHWLAVMRLLGASDLHAENLIACGPVPVVVDCETLFTPLPPAKPMGLGLATDRAAALIDGTVARTGLLPGRGVALGWRGVDISGAGALPGEQPTIAQPVIVDEGTDQARMGIARLELKPAANQPSDKPVLDRYWGRVIAGFDELTAALIALDRAGRLAPALSGFADCPIRVVPRATEVYAELERMLWHPVSLHDQATAVARATDVLTRMARNSAGAPDDSAVVKAEVAELLDGDIPLFTTTPRRGRLTGPRGTGWLPEKNLIDEALQRWRAADIDLEREVIRATLVSAYLNEGWLPGEESLRVTEVDTDNLERRRRALAAEIVRQIQQEAITGDDGTVTWIAPVLNDTGWAVQPFSADLYGGLTGMALLLAAYLREVSHGRADEVPGLEATLNATLRTLRLTEDWRANQQRAGTRLRPLTPGGYIGLGSRVWAWLLLERWGVTGAEGVERARALAELIPESVAADEVFDVLVGTAGAIVPLLQLAARTGETRWLTVAVSAGDRLLEAARRRDDGAAYWPTARWPNGLGGFAHGTAGIGWALRRLALATDDARFHQMADAAAAFDESLYDPQVAGWRDRRDLDQVPAAWCHGSVGIGLAAADLLRRVPAPTAQAADHRQAYAEVLRRAVTPTYTNGLGWNHTLCHGDLGSWELLDTAIAAGLGPTGLDRPTLDAQIIASVERHGPVSGIARDAFSPGLLPGVGGVAYQLLRLHPESDLPSVLIAGGDPI